MIDRELPFQEDYERAHMMEIMYLKEIAIEEERAFYSEVVARRRERKIENGRKASKTNNSKRSSPKGTDNK